MKLIVLMKTPDCLESAINDYVDKTKEDWEVDANKIKELLGRWFEFDEIVKLEIDTEIGVRTRILSLGIGYANSFVRH